MNNWIGEIEARPIAFHWMDGGLVALEPAERDRLCATLRAVEAWARVMETSPLFGVPEHAADLRRILAGTR
jgi:hypothetical protein